MMIPKRRLLTLIFACLCFKELLVSTETTLVFRNIRERENLFRFQGVRIILNKACWSAL